MWPSTTSVLRWVPSLRARARSSSSTSRDSTRRVTRNSPSRREEIRMGQSMVPVGTVVLDGLSDSRLDRGEELQEEAPVEGLAVGVHGVEGGLALGIGGRLGGGPDGRGRPRRQRGELAGDVLFVLDGIVGGRA